ncbi:MAG: MATE family efflux transporter [Proteobacteria bacterium]|nr:MATE family efflux transporter [Pseudomonadota bacterium]
MRSVLPAPVSSRVDRGSIARELIALASPAIAQQLLHTFVFLADRLMLGRFSADALASMQISGPVMWSLFSIGTAFAAGTIAVIGRAVGARDAQRARHAVLAALSVALAFGLTAGVLGWAARASIAQVLTGGDEASETVRQAAHTYLGIVFPCLPFQFIAFIGTCALQASGDTRTPAIVAALVHVLNVLGNWVLIYGHLGAPSLGVAGAAMATGAAFALQAAAIVAALMLRQHAAKLVITRPTRGHVQELVRVMRVSRAAFAEKVVFHAGFLAFVGLIGRLGDVAMAANQATIAIESLGFLTAEGFGIAGGALVAQRLGARQPEQAAAAGWIAVGLGAALLCLASVLFLSAPEFLVGLFVQDRAVVELGAKCLLIGAAAQPAMGAGATLAANLRAAGDTRTPLLAALVGTLGVRVGATYFLAFVLDLGLVGVWLGSTCDWSLRALWLALVFRVGRWQRIEV